MNDQQIISMGADPRDYNRSSVAKRIFSLAASNEFLFAHYEYRWPVPVPEGWLDPNLQAAQGEVHWQAGVLSELKYQSFRHDSVVCNFHPGQSSKWGAHELCHKLVGYAWKPKQGLLYHTLAAWAAEVLPVTVYYFWDEMDCFKCEKHKAFSQSPMSYCAACDKMAAISTDKRLELLDLGWDFLNTQLAAIEESIKKQSLMPAPLFSLDLADDAYHYSLSQLGRLNSESYSLYMNKVVSPALHVAEIEDLITRVREVAASLVEGAKFKNFNLKRHDWVVMDLGSRLLELAENMDVEVREIFLRHFEEFATTKDINAFINSYQSLLNEYELPKVEELFATGYSVTPSLGYYNDQVKEGIISVIPKSFEQLDIESISNFLDSDRGNRDYLGARLEKYFDLDTVRAEVFINQPQGFFEKTYTSLNLRRRYKWADRVRLFKSSDTLKALLEVDAPYILLFKSQQSEVFSYAVSAKEGEYLQKSFKNSFYLDELQVSLEEKQFYVQSYMLVESSEE